MSRFEAVLNPDPGGPGTFIRVPRALNGELGLRGRPKIRAVIAGHPYRGSLMPMGDGTFSLGVLKSIQAAARAEHGDTVTVDLELDRAPRVVEPPSDLSAHLAQRSKAAAAWAALSYTSRKEIARDLEGAKKPETRARRLASVIARLG